MRFCKFPVVRVLPQRSQRRGICFLIGILGAFLVIPSLLASTDLTPWLTKDFEFQPRVSILYQNYPQIATKNKHANQSANDQFYTAGVELSAFDYSVELETTLANTRRQHYCFDDIRLTGRYRILNDIPGEDPVSLTAGITFIKAFTHSLHDVSSFHHGQFETEAHIAVGKETPIEEFWMSRWWAVFVIGFGDHGSPWIRTQSAWEKNWCDCNQLRLFANTLWGLGNSTIQSVHHFNGYGLIDHRSVDLGFCYTHLFDFSGTLSLKYIHRLYAHNFPEHTNLLQVSFVYPFGL
jgi:hypothetical protein